MIFFCGEVQTHVHTSEQPCRTVPQGSICTNKTFFFFFFVMKSQFICPFAGIFSGLGIIKD